MAQKHSGPIRRLLLRRDRIKAAHKKIGAIDKKSPGHKQRLGEYKDALAMIEAELRVAGIDIGEEK